MTKAEEQIPSPCAEAYKRIQSIANTRTQVELAEMLGIRQSSISDALRRGEIPNSWLVKLYEVFSVNPTWIKTGEGSQFLQGVDEMPPGPRFNRQQLSITMEKNMVAVSQRIVDEIMALPTSPVFLEDCHCNDSFPKGDI